MSGHTVHPEPHELRMLARTQDYANSSLEAETIRLVDQLVFDRVRTFEQATVDAANDFREAVTADMTAAKDIGTALADEVRTALDQGADPAAVAKRFEQLRRAAETALASLERAEREAEWHASKVADPYATYSALMSRYAVLRPAIAL